MGSSNTLGHPGNSEGCSCLKGSVEAAAHSDRQCVEDFRYHSDRDTNDFGKVSWAGTLSYSKSFGSY